MRTSPRLLPLLSVAVLTFAPPLVAQAGTPSRLSFAGRAGAAFPVGNFADSAGTGFHLSAEARYAVLPPLSVYAGYRYTRYPLDAATADNVTIHGPMVGVALGVPTPQPVFGAHVGVFLPSVRVGGSSSTRNPDYGLVAGVRAGTRFGGFGASAFLDGEYCGTPWPHGFPSPPKGFIGGVEISRSF